MVASSCFAVMLYHTSVCNTKKCIYFPKKQCLHFNLLLYAYIKQKIINGVARLSTIKTNKAERMNAQQDGHLPSFLSMKRSVIATCLLTLQSCSNIINRCTHQMTYVMSQGKRRVNRVKSEAQSMRANNIRFSETCADQRALAEAPLKNWILGSVVLRIHYGSCNEATFICVFYNFKMLKSKLLLCMTNKDEHRRVL